MAKTRTKPTRYKNPDAIEVRFEVSEALLKKIDDHCWRLEKKAGGPVPRSVGVRQLVVAALEKAN